MAGSYERNADGDDPELDRTLDEMKIDAGTKLGRYEIG